MDWDGVKTAMYFRSLGNGSPLKEFRLHNYSVPKVAWQSPHLTPLAAPESVAAGTKYDWDGGTLDQGIS